MDIESLKKIDFTLKIKREKSDPFPPGKKKKPKSQGKEEKNKSRIDIKV